jgi:proteasome accessory factor B
MPERITKTQRWLDLIALLLGRRVPMSVEEIMERVPAYATDWTAGGEKERASVRRKFERDKDELRRLGIPLESVTYAVNYGAETIEGYRILRRDFYLPYLRVLAGDEEADDRSSAAGGAGGREPNFPAGTLDLSPDEAALSLNAPREIVDLTDFPFAAEARSAYAKLTFDLDPDRYPAVPVHWADDRGSADQLDRLEALSDALLGRKRVRFRYRGIARGESTDRDVAGYGLFFHGDWYLVGHDAARDAVRVFRVSRMEEVHPNATAPKTPDYEVPADFDLRSYVDRRPWELEGEAVVEADVRFRFPASIWAERNGEGEVVREEPGGAVVRRFQVRTPNPFLRWTLSFAGEAEIVAPPELVSAFRAMAAEVAAVHGRADA